MRVIAGKCKGRRLIAPKGKHVRPALDQVKEAVFNILFDINDLDVLDLFAGSGSIGIEALSRGASSATFVEKDSAAYRSITENLEKCNLQDQATVWKLHVSVAIKKLDKNDTKFDLIFVDPPYLKDLVNPTLEQLASSSLLKDKSIVVIEHHPKEPIADIPGMTLTETRKYGQTLITFMKRQ
jgi:16S rRNA (guanine(966)-N(2))-methyltransferase RsmD